MTLFVYSMCEGDTKGRRGYERTEGDTKGRRGYERTEGDMVAV